MKPFVPKYDCEFEPEVLAAVTQSRWPEGVDAELRSHVAGCLICTDVAAIAGAFDTARDATRASANIPDSGRVWWLAQIRARREAIEAAGRPVTAAQAIAFASVIGVLGAFFGATSAWLQSALKYVALSLSNIDLKGFILAGTQFAQQHLVVVFGLSAVLLVIPAAFLFALGSDKQQAFPGTMRQGERPR